ncbi:hypothetical protein Tco_0573778 [Tanacetum coccineum]
MAELQTINTVVAYNPFPSTDETEQRPLREFLISFLVLNGHIPLTLDFNTFCSSTGLDYNNGKYVAHPIPEAVKKKLGKIAINLSYLDKTLILKNSFPVAWRIMFTFVIQVLSRNYSSTKQVNSIQQHLPYCLITRTEVDIEEIIYSDLVTKLLNKSRLKYVSYPRFISCALQVLLGYDYPQDEKFRFLHGILVSSLPLVEKPKKGKSQNVTLTSPKSQGPEVPGALSKKSKKPKSKKPPTETKFTPPKPMEDSEQSHSVSSGIGHLWTKIQGKTYHLLIWNKYTPPVTDLLGTGAKYQVDLTQSTRLSKEDILGTDGEIDEEPQVASIAKTYRQSPPPQADKSQSSHAPSTEASDTDSSSDDIFRQYHNILPLIELQLVMYLRKMSIALFTMISTNNWEKHEEAVVNYVDLKASINDYNDENIAHRDYTDKLVEASMSSLDKSSNTISDLYKGLNIITELLKEIKNDVKDDSVINKKITEATVSFTKFSTNITDLQSSMNTLHAHALKHDEELAV